MRIAVSTKGQIVLPRRSDGGARGRTHRPRWVSVRAHFSASNPGPSGLAAGLSREGPLRPHHNHNPPPHSAVPRRRADLRAEEQSMPIKDSLIARRRVFPDRLLPPALPFVSGWSRPGSSRASLQNRSPNRPRHCTRIARLCLWLGERMLPVRE